jgi:hypothetical protein
MLTQGPLVGEAEVKDAAGAVQAVRGELVDALGDRFGQDHEEALRRLEGALRGGQKSWRSAGVWVTLE